MKFKFFDKLSKFILLYSVLTLVFNQVSSQNLVPNPSFEEFINFENSNSNGWHAVQKTDTPDYFNLSATNPHNNVFSEFIGGTAPKSGNSFVGIFCYRVNINRKVKNLREYVETSLIQGLEKDSLYRVEISLCLDKESNTAVNNFSIMFSPSSHRSTEDAKFFLLKPQIEFNFSYTDSTHNWITLQSFYKATGNEKYLILGNIRTDKTTKIRKISSVNEKGKKKKWNLETGERAAYYYLDDVNVNKIAIVEQSKELVVQTEEVTDSLNLDEIKVDSAVVLRNIVFEFDKWDLLPESYGELNKLYHLMANNPSIRIKLEGHTDNIGSYDYNLKLSLKRVESVALYLIEKGINPIRIEIVGYSYSYPLTSNSKEEGRKINRRVVFKIIQK